MFINLSWLKKDELDIMWKKDWCPWEKNTTTKNEMNRKQSRAFGKLTNKIEAMSELAFVLPIACVAC